MVEPSTINGLSYTSGGSSTAFYSNGQISRSTLFPAGQVIDDIVYAWHFIYFYPDGQTKQGQLEGDQTITNHGTEYSLEDDDWIRFRADGTYHSHGAVDWNF